jgi:hypothetical protein
MTATDGSERAEGAPQCWRRAKRIDRGQVRRPNVSRAYVDHSTIANDERGIPVLRALPSHAS